MKFLDDSAYIISIIKSALRTMTFTDVINARTDSNWNEQCMLMVIGTSFQEPHSGEGGGSNKHSQ